MKIKPYGKNILVKPIEQEQVLVSQKKTLCEYGEVLDIGESVSTVKVGDKIGFTLWGLNILDVDNVKYYFIPEDDDFILGKIDESVAE